MWDSQGKTTPALLSRKPICWVLSSPAWWVRLGASSCQRTQRIRRTSLGPANRQGFETLTLPIPVSRLEQSQVSGYPRADEGRACWFPESRVQRSLRQYEFPRSFCPRAKQPSRVHSDGSPSPPWSDGRWLDSTHESHATWLEELLSTPLLHFPLSQGRNPHQAGRPECGLLLAQVLSPTARRVALPPYRPIEPTRAGKRSDPSGLALLSNIPGGEASPRIEDIIVSSLSLSVLTIPSQVYPSQ